MSPKAIPSLTSTYQVSKAVTLLTPPARYDHSDPEEEDLPLPPCTLDQGLRLPLNIFMKRSWEQTCLDVGPVLLEMYSPGYLPQLLDTSSSFEETIARVIGRKGETMGKKDVTDPSRLVDTVRDGNFTRTREY
ncbi:hypothetical protein Q3G72_023686 [Acer saccharum]|nr:hypothetical protein Q3G72_023686 [Acer saccharum]